MAAGSKATAITLPLMVKCIGGLVAHPSPEEGSTPTAVQAQLSAVDGQICILPMTAKAAEDLLHSLIAMLQLRSEEAESNDPPTLQ